MSNLHHHLPRQGELGGVGVSMAQGGQVVNHDQEEEDTERQDEAKYEPNINHLDVGSGDQLVRHGLVEGVHDQHGGHGHPGCGLEVF